MQQHNISSIQSFIHYVLSCIPVDIFMDPELLGEDAPHTSSSPALHFHRPWRSTSFILVLYQRAGVCSLSSGLSFLCENQALWLKTSLGCFCPLGGRDARQNEWELMTRDKGCHCPLSLHNGSVNSDLQLYLPITSVITCQATIPLLLGVHGFSHWSE